MSVPGTINFPATLDDTVSLLETANNAATTLTAAISNTDTTLSVASTTLFPSSGALTIDGEIIYYASKTSSTFTGCTRGRDGSTAVTHASGATVEMLMISRHHTALVAALVEAEKKIGNGSTNGTPTLGKVLRGTGAGSSEWTDALIILDNNKVGIGTTAPISLLANYNVNVLDATGTGPNGAAGLLWSINGNGYAATFENRDSTSIVRNGILVKTAATDTGSYALKVESGGVNRLTVRGDGKVGIGIISPTYQLQLSTDSAGKPTSSTWTVISDKRVKENITPFTDGLSILQQINPVHYNLNGKADLPQGAEGIGVVAQDVKDILPYTLSSFRTKLNPEDKEETELFGFNASALIFVLVNAVKELALQVQQLQGIKP